MGPVNYKEQVRQLYKRAVAEALEGAAEIKAEYADKILALIEEGGTDAIVLAEVEVQIPLVAQALALEVDDTAQAVLKEAARWARAVLTGLVLGM